MQIKKVSHSFDQYVTKQRWMSYHYQLKECVDSNSKSFLIIGKGDGIVPVILKQILEREQNHNDDDEEIMIVWSAVRYWSIFRGNALHPF